MGDSPNREAGAANLEGGRPASQRASRASASGDAREVVLATRDLAYTYPGADVESLGGVTLEVRRGEFVLLTGASGSGKSTLLRAFLGLVPHLHGGNIRGEVFALGLDVSTTLPHRLAARIGMVFQNPEDQLVASSVESDVAFGPENLGLPRAEVASRVEDALALAGVAPLRQRSVHELSVGQQQRVALAGALALRPEVLLLDEPTSQIDPKSAAALLANLVQLNRETGLTIVLAEHRLELALPVADRLIVMDRGRIGQAGQPREVLRRGMPPGAGVGLPPVAELSREIWLDDEQSLSVDELVARVGAKLGGVRPALGGAGPTDEARALPASQSTDRSTDRSADRSTEPPSALVQVEGLHHVYPNGAVALRGVGLEIAAGEAVAVLGQSGAGKSTLARHLNGLLKPSAGVVKVAGQDASRVPVSRLAAKVGYVFQNPLHQLFAASVSDELAMGPKALGWPAEEVEARVEDLLVRFELDRYRTRHPLSLSEGERRRVALAAALASRPRIVIMDEPTVGQDWSAKRRLGELIVELTAEGRAVLVITHDVEFASEHCPRFVVMAEGRVLADGPRDAVLDRPEVLSAAGLGPPQLVELGRRLAPLGFDERARGLSTAREELTRLLARG